MEKVETKDIFALYLASVQDPISDVERISKIYEENIKRKALSLREDFCGTFALSCSWVQSDENRIALGIDLDPEPLEYGRTRYLPNLSESEQSRVKTQFGNSITSTKAVDIIAAFNFSYCLINERAELLKYFKHCLESLNQSGMVIIDTFGGSDSEIPEIQTRDIFNHEYIAPFVFNFERKSFNPISRIAEYGIHFEFSSGFKLIDAFTYTFRAWTITEIRDLMLEAGFSKVKVYWEDFDEEGFGNGQFYETEVEENTLNWNAYIVGIK